MEKFLRIRKRILPMLKVTLMSGAKVVLQQDAHRVLFPGERGIFEVLEFHGPLASLLKKGSICVDEVSVPIEKGIMKAMNNEILAVVEFT